MLRLPISISLLQVIHAANSQWITTKEARIIYDSDCTTLLKTSLFLTTPNSAQVPTLLLVGTNTKGGSLALFHPGSCHFNLSEKQHMRETAALNTEKLAIVCRGVGDDAKEFHCCHSSPGESKCAVMASHHTAKS